MKKTILFAIAAMSVFAGCHKSSGQVPPSSPPGVQLTWTLPAASGSWPGCTTSAPCVVAVSRTAIASGSCPTPSTSGTPNYGLLATTGANVTSYLDASPSPGNINCYIGQIQQGTCPTTSNANAPCTAAPSNVVQLAVAALPPPLVLNTPTTTVAALAPPLFVPMPKPTVAEGRAPEPITLVAKLVLEK